MTLKEAQDLYRSFIQDTAKTSNELDNKKFKEAERVLGREDCERIRAQVKQERLAKKLAK